MPTCWGLRLWSQFHWWRSQLRHQVASQVAHFQELASLSHQVASRSHGKSISSPDQVTNSTQESQVVRAAWFVNQSAFNHSREWKTDGFFSKQGLRVWPTSNPGTRATGFDILCQSGWQPADRHLYYRPTVVFIGLLHSDWNTPGYKVTNNNNATN